VHGICRVPVSVNSISFARDFSDFRNLARCELDFQSTQILLEVLEGKKYVNLSMAKKSKHNGKIP